MSLKNNPFVRAIYFALRRWLNTGRKGFGYIADNVSLTPPPMVGSKI